MKTTDELLKLLNSTKSIESYFDNNSQSIIDISLTEYLNSVIEENDLTRSYIIQKSNLSSVYVYKILSGERHPQRDKLICLCFGMNMTLSQTQLALRLAGHSILYPKNRRDSIIIFALNERANLMECNEALYNLNENILE